MKQGIQADLLEIGKAGCYFLSLCNFALASMDKVVEKYNEYVTKGWMDYNCYIRDPVNILSDLTGKSWKYRWSNKPDAKATLSIGYWRKGPLGHFVIMENGSEKVKWDSYGENSPVVKGGKIDSFRLFYIS